MTALIVYCVLAYAWQIFSVVVLLCTKETMPGQRKVGARILILLPLAPLVVLRMLFHLVANLFRLADFRNKGEK